MKKIKLPRKRKKEFIKENGKMKYMTSVILGEVLMEENKKHYDRFYKIIRVKTTKSYPSGFKILKRW